MYCFNCCSCASLHQYSEVPFTGSLKLLVTFGSLGECKLHTKIPLTNKNGKTKNVVKDQLPIHSEKITRKCVYETLCPQLVGHFQDVKMSKK